MKHATPSPTEPVTFRMPVKMKAPLQKLAVADGRSFSGYVMKVLAAHLAEIRGR